VEEQQQVEELLLLELLFESRFETAFKRGAFSRFRKKRQADFGEFSASL
jgi:hypothetical protein